ncbi:hypothetical protein X777_01584, partial [Ooceraea biroi]
TAICTMSKSVDQRICIKFCVANQVLKNRRISVRELAAEVEISKTQCHVILTEVAKNSVNIVSQAPYSPDMAPCFFLFPKLKLPPRGHRFESIEAIKENSLCELKAIPQSAFAEVFEDWKKRWHMYIVSNGEYFEGDKINIDE